MSRCEIDELFNLVWITKSSDSCDSIRDTATTSSALDLLVSAVKVTQLTTKETSEWMIIGLGNCMDDNNASMPNYYQNAVSEYLCRQTANEDEDAVAYDYQISCTGWGFCRVRTLCGPHHTPSRFAYERGIARSVTRTNKVTIATCYARIK